MTYTVRNIYRITDTDRPPGATIYLKSTDAPRDAWACVVTTDARLLVLTEGKTVTITIEAE